MEYWQLKQRQSLDLEAKILLSKSRIIEWYEYWGGEVYVSFSGGKDSTVLLHLVRDIYPNVKAVFIDTGLEYPEIRNFVKTIDNVIWLKPKLNFKQVIEKYGYPVISKENAQKIYEIRNTKSDKIRNKRLYGDSKGNGKLPKKWLYLIDSDIIISSKCCYHLKKSVLYSFHKKNNLVPYTGMMAIESKLRMTAYIQNGCNAFNSKNAISSPLAFWLEENIWEYIKKYNIKYSSIYNIDGITRTGCMFCMFGVHLEHYPNKFQLMKKTHPKHYDLCINKLGCGKVLDLINVPYD